MPRRLAPPTVVPSAYELQRREFDGESVDLDLTEGDLTILDSSTILQQMETEPSASVASTHDSNEGSIRVRVTLAISGNRVIVATSTASEDSLSFETVSSPPGCRDNEPVGGGGCTALALTELEVSPSVESAKSALNDAMGPFSASIREDFRTPEYVGIHDQQWHSEVVKRAVIAQDFHFHKLDLSAVNLKKELHTGDYLLDGVLNSSYCKMVKGKDIWEETDELDHSGITPAANEGHWRHSIAVSDGRKLEDEYTGEMSARWLWLDDHSRPDRAKGYFYKILKVYRISKCTEIGSGCKGACLKRKAKDQALPEKRARRSVLVVENALTTNPTHGWFTIIVDLCIVEICVL